MKLRKKHKWAIFKALLNPLFRSYCIVVVTVILVDRGSAWVTGSEWAMYSQNLTRLLLMSFAGMFPFLLSAIVETGSPKAVLISGIVRFIMTAALVLGVYVFIEPTGSGIDLRVIVVFLLVYAVISVYSYFNAITISIKENELAEQINRQLDALHKDENVTHTD